MAYNFLEKKAGMQENFLWYSIMHFLGKPNFLVFSGGSGVEHMGI